MNKCLYCGKPVKNKYCNVSCQNRHQNPLRKKKRITIKKKCLKCGKEFEQIIIKNGKSYIKKYCSRKCANSRIQTEEMNRSRSEKLKKKIDKKEHRVKSKRKSKRKSKTKEIVCKKCGKKFEVIDNYKNRNRKFCSSVCGLSGGGRMGGKKSAIIQANKRRSKNEKYFCELCNKHFNNVDNNKPIFDGWDADVIIYDINVAIL